jgi:hypothetical protein
MPLVLAGVSEHVCDTCLQASTASFFALVLARRPHHRGGIFEVGRDGGPAVLRESLPALQGEHEHRGQGRCEVREG